MLYSVCRFAFVITAGMICMRVAEKAFDSAMSL